MLDRERSMIARGVARRWRKAHRGVLDTVKTLAHGLTSPAPPLVKLRAWSRGFSSSSYLLYDLGRNDPAQYLPDRAWFPQEKREGGFRRVLMDKVLFSTVVGAHVPVPKVVAIVARGRICAADSDDPVNDIRSLVARAASGGGLIIKPAQGCRGRRVFRVDADSSRVSVNGEPIEFGALEARLASLDDYVVTTLVENADYAARIFPRSTNTIRVITMQDPADGHKPFIPVATHRFGVHESVPTDNWSRGGLVAKVDLATGRLGPAKRDPRVDRTLHATHPETGEVIEGVTIPHWHELVRAILGLAETLSFLTIVGWDVVVTNDGIVVIEGNNPPDRAIQKEHPFLADPRVRRFFEHHGAIGRRRESRTTPNP